MTEPAKANDYPTLSPMLAIRDAAAAVEFYKKAFGAEEVVRMPGPGGRVMHAEVKIGNSMLMLSDENPERGHLSPATRGGNTSSVMLYTDDVDKMFKTAIAAGAKSRGRVMLASSVRARITSTSTAVPTASTANAASGDTSNRVSSVNGFPPGFGKYSPKIIALASLPGAPRTM